MGFERISCKQLNSNDCLHFWRVRVCNQIIVSRALAICIWTRFIKYMKFHSKSIATLVVSTEPGRRPTRRRVTRRPDREKNAWRRAAASGTGDGLIKTKHCGTTAHVYLQREREREGGIERAPGRFELNTFNPLMVRDGNNIMTYYPCATGVRGVSPCRRRRRTTTVILKKLPR